MTRRAGQCLLQGPKIVLMFCAMGLTLGGPLGAAAQDDAHPQPDWLTDLGVAGVNIVVGAVTAGATAWIRGEDISEAFLKGAAGGGVVFAGKRVTVGRFDGAGLLGRQVASVGSSMVANGGGGLGWIEEVWLPVGPAWVQVRPRSGVRARVNLWDVGVAFWAATRPELRFDLERSLSSGTLLFVAPDHYMYRDSDRVGGASFGGVIVLGASGLDNPTIQGHENVHVIQRDFLLQTMSRPLEQWGWNRFLGRDIPVDLSLVPLVIPAFGDLREREAEVLEHR